MGMYPSLRVGNHKLSRVKLFQKFKYLSLILTEKMKCIRKLQQEFCGGNKCLQSHKVNVVTFFAEINNVDTIIFYVITYYLVIHETEKNMKNKQKPTLYYITTTLYVVYEFITHYSLPVRRVNY